MVLFSVVATPIGNLEDITLRAIRTLREADLVVCEDTRMTKKLLDAYGITKPLMSYHSQVVYDKIDKVLDELRAGRNIALVSDAGTPGISDPGMLLVHSIRKELPEVKIQVIPGPSALAAAVSIAGVPANEFVFIGFLPHKKGRETLFKEMAEAERAYIFYESPHRIIKALESLDTFAPHKKVTVLRELTKVYEEVIEGSPKDILNSFATRLDAVRGEFVVIVSRGE